MLDGRQSLILNEIDATRCRSVCLKISYLAQDRLDLAEIVRQLALQMSEPCEFEFVPMKRAMRDLVAQIGNHTSKSEASIQSVNDGETENSLTDRKKAGQQREHKGIKKEKNCASVGTKPIFASVLQQLCKLQDWYSTDHGSHTPLQDDGDEPIMDLVTCCSPGMHVQTRCEHRGASETQAHVDREHRDGCAS